MTQLLEALVWRLTWWLVRLLWLPFVVISFAWLVVWPALASAAPLLISPAGILAGVLLIVWLWRR